MLLSGTMCVVFNNIELHLSPSDEEPVKNDFLGVDSFCIHFLTFSLLPMNGRSTMQHPLVRGNDHKSQACQDSSGTSIETVYELSGIPGTSSPMWRTIPSQYCLRVCPTSPSSPLGRYKDALWILPPRDYSSKHAQCILLSPPTSSIDTCLSATKYILEE